MPVSAPATPRLRSVRPLAARVDLGRLTANLRALQACDPKVAVLAVVKADAYGHGAVPVARALEAAGLAGFCVATLAEAMELRDAGIAGPVLVLGGVGGGDLAKAAARNIELTVVSADHLRELTEALPGHRAGLHLKLDTGMGRSGLRPGDLGASLDLIRALGPALRGAMAHFSDADEPDPAPTLAQRALFESLLSGLRDAGVAPPAVHHANSAGLLRGHTGGDSHARCGIALYGLCQVPEAAHLRPALELEAEVFRVARIPAGATVGYGRTWVAPAPATLATLACGYADGYPRALANRAWAGFRGGLFPVVGRISMDSLTVALPEGTPVSAGDRMTLLAADPEAPNSVAATARLLDTITYEVTCALHRRVARLHALPEAAP